ncbi:MAG: 3-oxo-5-alpha-steroid 4-dehydrogenase 1 [Myxococcota bacterium]|jgi:3-oxo-5-alpha-steroid 4-dehydrogenase 1
MPSPVSAEAVYAVLLPAWFLLAACAFIALQFRSAAYGRHLRDGWGPTLPSTVGWVVMELPAVVIPIALWATSDRITNPVSLTFLALWLLHYGHRTFIWPLRMRLRGKRMPLTIPVLAFVSNVGIDWLNAVWLFRLSPPPDPSWFTDPRFVLGALLFVGGMALNLHSDEVLRRLRAPGETGYRIPHGGGYRWVSCPNYLGELIEWSGWAVLTWSMPGLAFAVWAASNLVPRALQNHAWYRETFPDYPPERRALVPGVL